MKITVWFNEKADTKKINFSGLTDEFNDKTIKRIARRLVRERLPEEDLNNIRDIEWRY